MTTFNDTLLRAARGEKKQNIHLSGICDKQDALSQNIVRLKKNIR